MATALAFKKRTNEIKKKLSVIIDLLNNNTLRGGKGGIYKKKPCKSCKNYSCN